MGLPELVTGQVRVVCPICGGSVTMMESDPHLPEHMYEEFFMSAMGKGAVELPVAIRIKCIASGGEVLWKWLG